MGKRSDFPRRPRDAYPTPEEAVLPLLDHLEPGCTFEEPCCGNGQLVEHLERHSHKCLGASDIMPWSENPRDFMECNDEIYIMAGLDARKITSSTKIGFEKSDATYFITNPPWERDVLHGIIKNLASIKPTWLLIDADWMHTKQAIPYMLGCEKILSVGRVKWIPGSKNTGKDNCCWYLFDTRRFDAQDHHDWHEVRELVDHLAPIFHPRRND